MQRKIREINKSGVATVPPVILKHIGAKVRDYLQYTILENGQVVITKGDKKDK